VDFDNEFEIFKKIRKIDMGIVKLQILNSNVIIIINDDLNPVNIKSEEVK